MASVHQRPKTRIDASGKRVNVVDGKGNTVYLPIWRAQYKDHTGRKVKATLSAKTRKEALKQANQLEARERDICNGLRPAPTLHDRNAGRPFLEVVEEYLAWGAAQGGRRGRP